MFETMNATVLCFGEILLRLSSPNKELLLQSSHFDVQDFRVRKKIFATIRGLQAEVLSGTQLKWQVLVIQPFLTAAIAKASADVYLGHEVLVGPTFRYAVSRIHSILWITILLVLVVLIPGLVLVFFAALGATEIAVVLAVLMFVLLVLVFVRFVFGSTVLVVEGKKGSKALRRSWQLAKGHFWKILGTLVLAGIMASVVEGILSVPGAIAFAATGPGGWPFLAIGNSLAAIITTPFTTLITVLLYFDLRIRKEAFDLEVMAQEMSSPR